MGEEEADDEAIGERSDELGVNCHGRQAARLVTAVIAL